MPNRPLKIAFWGNFGTRNWGNECTLQAIVHHVRERLPDAELSCICFEPGDTKQRHNLPALPISYAHWAAARGPTKPLSHAPRLLRRAWAELGDWARTFESARHLDVVVMTGTGMLTDTSESLLGLPYGMFKWVVAVKLSGGRLFFTSVGVEPIHHRAAKLFIFEALRMADYRSYRDEQSRDHLRRMGFAVDRDPVFPDLAFSLPTAAARARVSSAARPKPKVAVGVFDYRGRGKGGPNDAEAYRAYLEKLGTYVLWLLEHGYPVRIIIGDLSYDELVRNDLRVWLETRGLTRYPGQFEDQAATSVEQVMDQIADADLVVASRFHNVLLALFLGKPVASISYNVKNDALMGQMGLADYCQSIGELDVDVLIEQFCSLERNAVRLKSGIVEKTAAYRDQLAQQYTALFGAAPASNDRPESKEEHAEEEVCAFPGLL